MKEIRVNVEGVGSGLFSAYSIGGTLFILIVSACRIPSALGQGLWTFGLGPWLLYRIRKIDDVHYWRLQTSLALLFRLAEEMCV